MYKTILHENAFRPVRDGSFCRGVRSISQVPKYFGMGSRRAGRVRHYVLLLYVLIIIILLRWPEQILSQ